ncbi:unnamed protein product [Prunus armeniaca]
MGLGPNIKTTSEMSSPVLGSRRVSPRLKGLDPRSFSKWRVSPKSLGKKDIGGRKLGTRVPKVKWLPKAQGCMSQGEVARHEGSEGYTKLACLQGNVLRHGGAEGKRDAEGDTKLACHKAM